MSHRACSVVTIELNAFSTKWEYFWTGIRGKADGLSPIDISFALQWHWLLLQAFWRLCFSHKLFRVQLELLRSPEKIYKKKRSLIFLSALLNSGVFTSLFGQDMWKVFSWSPSLQYCHWEHPRLSHLGSDEGFVDLSWVQFPLNFPLLHRSEHGFIGGICRSPADRKQLSQSVFPAPAHTTS